MDSFTLLEASVLSQPQLSPLLQTPAKNVSLHTVLTVLLQTELSALYVKPTTALHQHGRVRPARHYLPAVLLVAPI